MINDAFWNMWSIADGNSPLLSLDITVDDVGSLTGDLDAPVVSLNVTSSDPQLYFLVTFTSGTLTLDTSSTPNKTWDVSGWIFSFPVNIGRLSSFSALYVMVAVDNYPNRDQYSQRRRSRL
jgi:hypothetical protein